MRFIKQIAMVLCLCVIFSLFPISAFAQDLESLVETVTPIVPLLPVQEPAETIEAATEEEPEVLLESLVHVNPLYSDTVTETMIEEATACAAMLLEDAPEYSESEFSDVAAWFREGARCRAPVISFSYTTDDYDAARLRSDASYRKASIGELARKIVQAAMAHTGAPDEGDYLRWNYRGWNLSYSLRRSGDAVTVVMTFSMSYYTTADQEADFAAYAAEVLAELDLERKSDYHVICAIYDYICDNVSYDYDNLYDDDYILKYSAYAALMDGTAVCQGYASLFYYMALSCGLDTRVIAGSGNGENHAWNIVRLGDLYYYADTTWDAPRKDYVYFLQGKKGFGDHWTDAEYATAEFCAQYPISSSAYDPDSAATSGSCGDSAVWVLSPDGVLTISGSGDMTDYDSFRELPWHDLRDSVTAVVIEKGITSVGDCAFLGFDRLLSATLPEGLVSVGKRAFDGCAGLSKIVLPESTASIGSGAFSGSGLTEVTVLNDDCMIGADRNTLGDPDITVIHGSANSAAQRYAQEYGYSFAVDSAADLNHDGWLNALDLVYLMKLASGAVSGETAGTGDLTGDGTADILDIMRLLRICAGDIVM